MGWRGLGGRGGVESPLEGVLWRETTPFLAPRGGTGGVICTGQSCMQDTWKMEDNRNKSLERNQNINVHSVNK